MAEAVRLPIRAHEMSLSVPFTPEGFSFYSSLKGIPLGYDQSIFIRGSKR